MTETVFAVSAVLLVAYGGFRIFADRLSSTLLHQQRDLALATSGSAIGLDSSAMAGLATTPATAVSPAQPSITVAGIASLSAAKSWDTILGIKDGAVTLWGDAVHAVRHPIDTAAGLWRLANDTGKLASGDIGMAIKAGSVLVNVGHEVAARFKENPDKAFGYSLFGLATLPLGELRAARVGAIWKGSVKGASELEYLGEGSYMHVWRAGDDVVKEVKKKLGPPNAEFATLTNPERIAVADDIIEYTNRMHAAVPEIVPLREAGPGRVWQGFVTEGKTIDELDEATQAIAKRNANAMRARANEALGPVDAHGVTISPRGNAVSTDTTHYYDMRFTPDGRVVSWFDTLEAFPKRYYKAPHP